jgi:hypothetical protein
MLHPLTFAFAIFLAQDGAPTPAAPKTTPPAPPVQEKPAPLPVTTVPKSRPAPASQPGTAPANVAKHDAKAIVIPTPRVKEPEVPSYRVAVTMPGNRRFTGVITRDKLFNDLVRQNAHNTQDVYRRSEAFTLRFVDGVDGDVTLRWNQIVKLDVRAILDSAGVRTIEENYHRLMILKKEQEEAEKARQAAEEEKAKEKAQGEGDKPADGDKADPKRDEELPPLLAEFRPDAGWSEKKKLDIEWRRTIVGTAPDKEEARFLEVYPQWLEALKAWQAAKAAKPDDAKKGDAKSDDAKKTDAKKDDAKKDDAKKDEPKSDDDKKDAKKDESKGDDSKKREEKKDDDKKDGDEDGKKDDDSKKDDSPKDPAPAPEPKDDGGGPR